MMPDRIKLSRAKGWLLPENTVVVSRPTPWGNPFEVGVDGNRAECVRLYRLLIERGVMAIAREGKASIERQHATVDYVVANIAKLWGKNLACWCPVRDKFGRLEPCHANVLLEIANSHWSGNK